MKILLRFFAVIGLIVTLAFAVSVGMSYYQQEQAAREPDNVILTLDFDKPIVEQNEPSPLDLALHEDNLPLFDILHAIDAAKDDPHVKGIIARFGPTQPGLAQAQEIRDAIARFRESKKFTYAFAADYGSFGLGSRVYYLASAFQNIWLQPVGSVSLTGAAAESPFFKAALDKIGVTADFMQRKEYKSFMEPAERNDFSPPVRDMMQSIVDNISGQIADGIAQSRNWNPDRVKQLMTAGPFTDAEAVKAGLVTHLGYRDELDQEAKQKAGGDAELVNAENYLNFGGSGLMQKPKAKVALIYGTGLIMDKASGPAGLDGGHVMGADTISKAFNAAANDKDIKAILFRLDSPGGSPEASETIRRAMIHAEAMGKPVVVSMGEVAASGGYWVAMNASNIVAEPGTLTGSIGVLSGKFAFDGLMKKLGISVDAVKTAGNAAMWSMAAPFTPEQRAHVNDLLDRTYQEFTQNVAAARHIPMERMPDIAKGRVWTGAQAVKLGLVDELGGYGVALGELRKQLHLKDSDLVELILLPPSETPMERLLKLLRGIGVEGAMARTAFEGWQGLHAMMEPFLGDAAMMNRAVSAQIPGVYLRAVR